MTVRFTVLASGSSGNASVLECHGYGLMIDCGIGPRVIGDRLLNVGLSWKSISAVILTHTHSDHWNALTFAQLRRMNITLIAHQLHHDFLMRYAEYETLRKAGLVRQYVNAMPSAITPELSCKPVRIPHDAEPTYAFRFDAQCENDTVASLGYAADVGHITPALAETFAGVNVLALEFNHDVQMQKNSGRHPVLVNRVLGKNGHLSNEQAAAFTETIASANPPHGLSHLVQLHLSKDCNKPEIAREAGQSVLARCAPQAELQTASQFEPTKPILIPPQTRSKAHPKITLATRISTQLTLPGCEEE